MIVGITLGFVAVYNVLVALEVFFEHSPFHCHCSAIRPLSGHFNSVMLFVTGTVVVTVGLLYYYLDTTDEKPFLIFALDAAITASGGWYFWRWWVHTKNKRKKIAKSLSKVRVTSAGLKVVPNNVT